MSITDVEQWRTIEEFPTYEVSTLGRVRRNGRVKQSHVMTHRPYRRVTLFKESKEHARVLHVLVALAFLGKRPDGHHIEFADGDTTNCRLDNLSYSKFRVTATAIR